MNFKQFKNFDSLWRLTTIAIALLTLLIAFAVVRIKNETAQRFAESAQAAKASKDEIPFIKTARPKLDNQQIQIWQSTRNARSLVRFGDSFFVATDGGLVQYSETGEIQKHFTVLDGLTESDLNCLAVFDSKLFIGTASTGLLSFDGERFENYRWKDRKAKSINALLALDDKLLIGTFAGGLIEFDNARFREIKPENERLSAINFLAGNAQKLFVGTFNDGLWISDAGRWQHFTKSQGLPSNRIIGIAATTQNLFVGTDFGVAQADSNDLFAADQNNPKVFHNLATIPALSSLTFFNNQIFACQDDGKFFVLVQNNKKSFEFRILEWNKPNELTNARLIIEDNNLFLVSAAGVWQAKTNNSSAFSLALFLTNSVESLTNNVVSALSVNSNDTLWAGTFRNGIDVLTREGKQINHFENEIVREINFLLFRKETGKTLAATSAGVTEFDRSARVINIATNDALKNHSVSYIAANEKELNKLFFATNRGLAFETPDGFQKLSKPSGLPSDNIYAVLFHQNSLFVGTLGGLAQIEKTRVTRVFKDSNSNLTVNWTTALCAGRDRLFIGTYGGGVFELTAAGELHAFANETGKLAVNPNAMWSDDNRLYVGTLDGVWVLDLSTQRWSHLTDELPAKTVLSIIGDRENVYFGTTNGIARISQNFWLDKQNPNKQDDEQNKDDVKNF